MLASYDEDDIADDELLTETGSGGVFTSGYLHDRPLIEYLAESERVAYLLSNSKKGIRRESDAEASVHAPGDGYRAVAAVTDTRVLFVVGDGNGDEVFDVPHTEIEDVKTGRGMLTKHLDVWSTAGVCWQFYVKGTVDVEPAASYLERAAIVWSRAERQLQHARKRFVDANEAVSADEYDAAREALESAREHVAEAREMAEELTSNRDDAIWERVRAGERRLAAAAFEAHRSHGQSLARAAERAWRSEQYNAAYEDYVAARERFERALEVGRERGFAETAAVEERLGSVDENLDQLAGSPLRRAREAHDRAKQADDPAAAVERLEDALEKYQTALVLDWGHDDGHFAGDRESLRSTVSRLANEIELTRRTLAERARSRGDDHRDAGRTDRAREAYETARSHLEAALGIVRELRPDLEDDLREEIATVEAELERVEAGVGAGGFQFVGDAGTDADD
ncbi:MAG: hypothetical protein ABEJ30_07990 [Halorientalis sp.]